MESILLNTTDGHELVADLLVPADGSRGGVVVCHPHPHHGGNRFHPVVDAVFRHLPRLGFSTLRFDFRAAFGGGVAERLDVVAALDALAARTGGPLAVVGYSFGAAVGIDTHDDRVAAVVAIAPPLSMMQVGQPSAPVLVLAPQHDQFTTPDDSAAIVAGWPHAQFRVIDAADHLLVGRAQLVARTAGDWLDAHR